MLLRKITREEWAVFGLIFGSLLFALGVAGVVVSLVEWNPALLAMSAAGAAVAVVFWFSALAKWDSKER
jgi:hypothetical protein